MKRGFLGSRLKVLRWKSLRERLKAFAADRFAEQRSVVVKACNNSNGMRYAFAR